MRWSVTGVNSVTIDKEKGADMRDIVMTGNAPKAVGPYSQGVKCCGLVFTSGQLPIDPETGKFAEGGICEQTEQSMKNVGAVLDAAGSSLENAVKATVYLQDIGDFKEFNRIYETFFKGDPPARSAFEVAALPLGALVEIEMIAESK